MYYFYWTNSGKRARQAHFAALADKRQRRYWSENERKHVPSYADEQTQTVLKGDSCDSV